MKKMILIDGNSLLFRAYYASIYGSAQPLTNKAGVPTNAVYVFANMIHKLLFSLPEHDELHVLVAFDTGKKTFRHEQLESYKAHRKPVPDDLIQQFPIARELLKALQLFTFEQDGFEGDDVAGTMAIRAKQEGYEVEIFTSDRDFLQLCQPGITVKLIKKGVSDILAMTPEKVVEDFGITPAQVPDYKGLVGDASDNIPGIPGIGDKTAVKLLQQYGDLNAVLAAAPTMSGKLAVSLQEHRDLGILSKELAIIHTTMELPFGLEETRFQGVSDPLLKRFIQTYDMRSLADRFLTPAVVEKKTWAYADFAKCPDIHDGPVFIVPIGQATNYYRQPNQGYVLYDLQTAYVIKNPWENSRWRSVIANANVLKTTYDSKRLYVDAMRHQCSLEGLHFDVQLATLTLDETPSLQRKQIFFNVGVDLEDDELIQAVQMAMTLPAMEKSLQAELQEKALETIVYNIEFPLARVLAKMEIEGIPLDIHLLATMEKELHEKIQSLKAAMDTYTTHPVNYDSPKQVSEWLFDELKLPNYKKGSTSVDVLKGLIDHHPVVGSLLDYRKYAKFLSTYVASLPSHQYEDGKLHPLYNQVQTTTGRLSSFDPNIQNISVKDDETKRIRQAFYYEKPWCFLSFDYSQIELRILAELSKCQALIDDFSADLDIHTTTAQRLFAQGGTVTSAMRRQAKAVNFGIIYGISSWGLADQLNIAPQEASQLIQQFYEAYPELKQFNETTLTTLQDQQYVSTLLGRRRYLRDIKGNFQAREFAKRAAMNAPIQGTAADLLKLAMIQIDAFLEKGGYQTKMIATIHDEILFKCHEDERDELMPKLQDLMEKALPMQVRLKVEGSYASSWYAVK